VYVTNAVKHFKWEPRGKRRIHKKPNSREIAACRPWLEAELRLVKPKLLVCLGATAAQAIFGPSFRVTRARQSVVVQVCAACPCHGSPILSASAARRGIPQTRIRGLRHRSSCGLKSSRRRVGVDRAAAFFLTLTSPVDRPDPPGARTPPPLLIVDQATVLAQAMLLEKRLAGSYLFLHLRPSAPV
jgi:hypothetical protein